VSRLKLVGAVCRASVRGSGMLRRRLKVEMVVGELNVNCCWMTSSKLGFCGHVNAETPPFLGGVSDAAGEPDDYLLSHG
jgi:hypothetical protein